MAAKFQMLGESPGTDPASASNRQSAAEHERWARRLLLPAVLVLLTATACTETSPGTPAAVDAPPATSAPTNSPTSATAVPSAEPRFADLDPCALGDPATLTQLGLTPTTASDIGTGMTQCLFNNRANLSIAGVLLDSSRPYSNYATPTADKVVQETTVDGRRTASLIATNSPECIVAVDFGGTDTLAAQSDIENTTPEQNCVYAQQLARYGAANIPMS